MEAYREKAWFEYRVGNNDQLAEKHEAAYKKSLTTNRAIKVHSGCYYYRGWELNDDGYARDYKWSYENPYEYDSKEWASTMAKAKEYIDWIIEHKRNS